MSKKLSTLTKLGYSTASIGDAATYGLFNSYLMFFLTTIAGIDPAIAGLIAALGAIWDSLWSPIIGFFSDNSKSKHGRRRPFIFIAAFPMALTSCFAFTTFDVTPTFKVFYYLFMVLLFWFSFASFFIPYLALGAEITDDYDERTELRSFAYIFGIVGMVVGMVLPTVIVDLLINYGNTPQLSWQVTGAIVGTISFISILITWKTTKGKELIFDKDVQSSSNEVGSKKAVLIELVKGYYNVLKLKPLRLVLGISIFYLLAHAMHTADRMYYFTYNMGLTAGQISGMMLLITCAGAFLMPLILKLAKKFDKRTVLIFGFATGAVLITSMRFIGIDSILSLSIFAMFFAISNTCYWQLAPAIIYDVCELDELISGKRREGTVVSLLSLSEALSSAISMQVLGLILKFSGFNGDAPMQTATSLFWTSNCFTVIPAIFIIIALIMAIRYPIGKKQFNIILALVEQKREGEQIDTSPIDHLL